MSETTLEYIALSGLEEAERNPKQHSLDLIEESIVRFGFTIPLLVDENSQRIVAGHGRLKALRRLKTKNKKAPSGVSVLDSGEWTVPVLRGIQFSDESEAQAYLLADNRTTEAGGWDEIALSEMLSDLNEKRLLVGVGWNSDELDALLDKVGMATPEDAAKKEVNPLLSSKETSVKIVVGVSELGVFERAVLESGEYSRGDALMKICRFYLERNSS